MLKSIITRGDITDDPEDDKEEVSAGGWAIAIADARGAISGGIRGFRYGAFFSPTEAAAGAAVGAILEGAAESIIAAYIDSALCPEELTGFDWEQELYDPLSFYENYFCDDQLMETICEAAVSSDIAYDEEYEDAGNVGPLHNIMLARILRTGESGIGVPVTEDPEPEDEEGIDELTYEILTSEEYCNEWRQFIDNCFDGTTSQDDYDLGLSNTAAKVQALFEDIYFKYPQGIEDLDYVVSYYVKQIQESSELSEQDRIALLSGLSVVTYSARFWSNK